MTAMPQLVAAFHSLVGLAAVLVAARRVLRAGGLRHRHARRTSTASSLIEMSLGVAIGAITFTGSIIAFLKLVRPHVRRADPAAGAPSHQHRARARAGRSSSTVWSVSQSQLDFWLITLIALALGVLIIIPIGGADMPVVVSMLNSYSGWAAAGIGFTLGNSALIITGALVGSSGAILSYIMCKGMNRSLHLGHSRRLRRRGRRPAGGAAEQRPVKLGSADDAAFIMKNAVEGHHRAGLRHGGGAGPACAARNGRPAQEGRRRGQIRHPSGRRPHARPHERAAGRSQCALRRGVRARGHQLGIRPGRRRLSSSAPTT